MSADVARPDLDPLPDAEAEVAQITQELIRIDTSNWGDSSETVGEAAAADYCAERLREVGLDPEVIVTTSDSRRAVHVRIPGTDPSAGALLLHGHIDVVPAMAATRSLHHVRGTKPYAQGGSALERCGRSTFKYPVALSTSYFSVENGVIST